MYIASYFRMYGFAYFTSVYFFYVFQMRLDNQTVAIYVRNSVIYFLNFACGIASFDSYNIVYGYFGIFAYFNVFLRQICYLFRFFFIFFFYFFKSDVFLFTDFLYCSLNQPVTIFYHLLCFFLCFF